MTSAAVPGSKSEYGFWVSTVGREESVIREYIRKQEEADKRLDQLKLWD